MTGQHASVVLIVIDALRYDCVPCAPPGAHMQAAHLALPSLPALQKLLHGAHQFTQAVACAPYTPAAFASIFTGTPPPQHGVRAHRATSLNPTVQTLPSILTSAGYSTCAMSDYADVLVPVGLLKSFSARVKDEDAAMDWWDACRAAPRFLLLHLWDVHKPYNMPVKASLRGDYAARLDAWHARMREHGIAVPADLDNQPHPEPQRHQVNVMECLWEKKFGWVAGLQEYLAGLQTFDSGRLEMLVAACRAHGIFDDAVVVVTSDHGEGRCENVAGCLSHAANLLDDTIRIPLSIRLPGAGNGRVIDDQVSQADIAPTILDLIGLSEQRAHTAHAGRSLTPLMHGERLAQAPAYAELSVARPAQGAAPPLEGDPASIVQQRILRYPERKIHLTGQPLRQHPAWLDAPAEVFVRSLYRDILGRFEGASGLAWWLDQLKDEGRAPDVNRRRAMINSFLESPEASATPRCAIYDLLHDPTEEQPRTPASDARFWVDYQPQLAIIEDIERHALPGAPLLPNESDEDVVIRRLQALGYIE